LKACLNHAWREGKIPSDTAWRRIRPFPAAGAARSRYLTVDEARRLIAACEPGFRDLVKGALLTGARFNELAALKVADYSLGGGTIHIRTSKSGKGRHAVMNAEGIALLKRLTDGRAGDEHIFQRPDGMVWGKSHQHRPFKAACNKAAISGPITFHELRHTWASLSIMAGAPLIVVAQNLGHSDSRMVERHYGHLAQSFVADTIRRTAPSFDAV
jgi:integrase